MVNIIKSLYSKVYACIKKRGKSSDFVYVSVGDKQRQPLSALIFILFLNDITNKLTESDLNCLTFFILLCADDIAVFITAPNSLQSQLNAIHEYSRELGLKIVNKTKVCIFEKRKQTAETFDGI